MMRWPIVFVLAVACSGKDGEDADGDGSVAGEDCNDLDPDVHPGAVEVCDPGDADEDCDGAADNADPDALGAAPVFRDDDGDGFGSEPVTACDVVAGLSLEGGDCDDADPLVSPEAAEICDAAAADEDCDGLADDDDDSADPSTKFAVWADADGDGYGDAAAQGLRCRATEGWTADSGDCDDASDAVHPGADEVCGGGDEDCDGEADEPDAAGAIAWGPDGDGDGYGALGGTVVACEPPDGFAEPTDCDDADPDTNPAAVETCDGADEDCDGVVDDAAVDVSAWFLDADGDGYGDPDVPELGCDAPAGYVADATDCDDGASAVNPGAGELCDAADADEDCDGLADDADDDAWGGVSWFADADGDGYGDAGQVEVACDAPAGHVSDASDCDDADAAVSPAASEACDPDDLDEDCDGLADDASASGQSAWYADADGDGHGDAAAALSACDAPAGHVASSDDCDDGAPSRHPDAAEICDAAGADEDCDGSADDADGSATGQTDWFADADGDGYGDPSVALSACDAAPGFVSDATDCDDADPAVSPGEAEVCGDATDDDCDGFVACDPDLSYAGAALIGEAAYDYAGWSVASAGDADGDGIDDVLVGARGSDLGGDASGAAYLVYGGWSGSLDLSAADLILAGESAGDEAGTYVSGAGDVDGDGLPDFVVAAPYDDDGGSDRGALTVVAAGASWAKLVGDAPGLVLTAAAGLGDVDGDGLGDVAAGCGSCDANAGRAWVFTGIGSGSTSFSGATLAIGGGASTQLGYAISGAGDLDGDGLDDLLVGAPNATEGPGAYGAAYVFLGPITGAETTTAADAVRFGISATDGVGYRLAAAGDVDGDGYGDAVIGGWSGGRLVAGFRVFSGPITGTSALAGAAASIVHTSSYTFGDGLAAGGDLDRDGYDDVAFGDPRDSRDDYAAGRVFVFVGPLSGALTEADADVDLVGGAPNEQAGYALAFVGARDGSGFADLVVGAPADATGGGYGAGAAFVFSAGDL